MRNCNNCGESYRKTCPTPCNRVMWEHDGTICEFFQALTLDEIAAINQERWEAATEAELMTAKQKHDYNNRIKGLTS